LPFLAVCGEWRSVRRPLANYNKGRSNHTLRYPLLGSLTRHRRKYVTRCIVGTCLAPELFPFLYRNTVTGKWGKGRYVAERHEIAVRAVKRLRQDADSFSTKMRAAIHDGGIQRKDAMNAKLASFCTCEYFYCVGLGADPGNGANAARAI